MIGFLRALLGLTAVAGVVGCQNLVLNDVHSRLNATRVARVLSPKSTAEVVGIVHAAERAGKSISIGGGRHAMGGQAFGSGTWHVDTSRLNRVFQFDRKTGRITVGSGMRWPQLLRELERLQPGVKQPWTFRQKQTGADELSMGGSVSANIHGRGLQVPPFVSEVESLEIVGADGKVRAASRSENAELFRLAVGGYGLFGIITKVELRLIRRFTVERVVGSELPVARLEEEFTRRIRDGWEQGDYQFKTDDSAPDFLRTGIFAFYRRVSGSLPEDAKRNRRISEEQWNNLYVDAHVAKDRAWKGYLRHYIGTHGQRYASDEHQLSFYCPDYEARVHATAADYPSGSLMITEAYVPWPQLEEFLADCRSDFLRHRTNIVYGTVRSIKADRETLLAWARQDYACVVYNVRVTHTVEGIAAAKLALQRIIDRAAARGGSFYLTYHRWARTDQLLRAYPQFPLFLRLKLKHDPNERFQSEWYRDAVARFAKGKGA
jgi:FAD/FMN-containing dehydrogenase